MEHDVDIVCAGSEYSAKFQVFEDLLLGDDSQKISVIQSLPQLIALDSSAVFNRIIPKIKQDLPSSSGEFQIATSSIFQLLLQRSANANILQAVIQGIDNRDPNVAYSWSEALFGAMGSLPEVMIQSSLLPLAKQKFQANSTVISKVFCGKLMGEICGHTKFRVLDVKRDIIPIVIGLCQDGSAEVRAQMCALLPKVAGALGNDWEKTNLLSCIVDLAQDDNLNVRSTSIIAITSMLKVLSQETSRNTLLPLIKKLCTKACEDSLVTAMILSNEFSALLRGMPYLRDQDTLFFVRVYKQLSMKGKQSVANRANSSIEITVRQRCASNTYAIMQLVLQSQPAQLQTVYDSFRDHAVDPCYLVRRAAAGVLTDIAQLLGNDNKIMKNEIVRLLRDDAVEVLDALIPTISALFTALTNSGALSYAASTQTTVELCKALTKCQNELAKRYNWRLSCEFMKQLEILPTCVPADYIHSNFTPSLFEKLVFGKAKPVRIQAARTLVVFLRYNFKPNQFKWIRDSLIIQTAQSRNCHCRMLYFSVCEAVLAIFSEKFFKEWFLAPCLVLASDKIVNIRWKFLQFSTKLKSMVTLATDAHAKQQIMAALNKLEQGEKNKTVLDKIRAKKRESPPRYTPEALREEEIRATEEATTNIKKADSTTPKKQGVPQSGNVRPTVAEPDMRFLEQHFYIDAGIKLESIIGLDNSCKLNAETHLDTTDLIAIETCNITDDAKVNLRNNIRMSKLTPPSSYSDTRNKRHSSIISAKPRDNLIDQRRRSLNLNRFSESKIPIANRSKLLTISRSATKDSKEENIEFDVDCNITRSSSIESKSIKYVAVSALPVDARKLSQAPPSRSSIQAPSSRISIQAPPSRSSFQSPPPRSQAALPPTKQPPPVPPGSGRGRGSAPKSRQASPGRRSV